MADLSRSITADQAKAIAERFVSREVNLTGGAKPLRPRGHYYEYLSGDGETIYEFPLVAGNEPSGYVLVSGTKSLPPIIEFCASGNALQDKLRDSLSGFLRVRPTEHTRVVWRYFGPMDFVAELATSAGKYLYIRVPNVKVESSDFRIIQKIPAFSDAEWIRSRWDYYSTTTASGPTAAATVLRCRPVKYNQTCQSSLGGDARPTRNEGPNYCTPVCIAGCVATAWTVLAGTWKGYIADQEIFRDALDWYFDWESSYGGPPPPHSKVVNQRMWDVHGYMNTSCGGSTYDASTPAGSRLFYYYGKPWTWGARFNVDYGFASSVNKANQPGLLTAQSNWTGSGIDGHGVVTYGWNDSEQSLYICLGWGAAFWDKWIAFATLSSAGTFFVTSWGDTDGVVASERNTPVVLPLDTR